MTTWNVHLNGTLNTGRYQHFIFILIFNFAAFYLQLKAFYWVVGIICNTFMCFLKQEQRESKLASPSQNLVKRLNAWNIPSGGFSGLTVQSRKEPLMLRRPASLIDDRLLWSAGDSFCTSLQTASRNLFLFRARAEDEAVGVWELLCPLGLSTVSRYWKKKNTQTVKRNCLFYFYINKSNNMSWKLDYFAIKVIYSVIQNTYVYCWQSKYFWLIISTLYCKLLESVVSLSYKSPFSTTAYRTQISFKHSSHI